MTARLYSLRIVPLGLMLVLVGAAAASASTDWQRGLDALEAGRYEEAIEAFSRVVAAHPDYAPGYFRLGLASSRSGRLEPSIAAMRRAIELDAKPEYRLHLSKTLLKAQRVEAAAEQLETLVREPPPEPLPESLRSALAALSASAAMSLEPDRGRTLLEATLARIDAPVLRRALGRLELLSEHWDRAYAAFAAIPAGERTPGDELARYQAAWNRAEQADETESQGWHDRAADAAEAVAAANADVASDLRSGRVWLRAGHPDRAMARFEHAESTEPENVDVLTGLARCAAELGEPERALEHYRRARELVTSDVERARIELAIARIHHRRGELEQAAAAYRRAGDTEQADQIVAALASRRELEQRRARCLDLKRRLDAVLEDSSHLRGTEAWEDLERGVAAQLAPCSDLLGSG